MTAAAHPGVMPLQIPELTGDSHREEDLRHPVHTEEVSGQPRRTEEVD